MRGNVHGGKQLGKDKKRVTLFVSADLHAKLVAAAQAQEKTLSDFVRDAVKESVVKKENG